MIEAYIEISGTKYSIVPGCTHIDRLDKELDTAKVIIRKLSRKLPFEPYTDAKLKLDSFERVYSIISDDPVRISATRELYTHTIYLVSREKILDLDVLPNLAFSNDLNKKKTTREQLDRLRKIYPTRRYTDIKNNVGMLFDIPSTGYPILDEETNQLFLGCKSVLGCLESILERTKLVPYFTSLDKTLQFKDLNYFGKDYTDLFNASGLNDFTSFNSNQDANYYSNFVKASVDNEITDKDLYYPGINQFNVVRAGNGEFLREDNCKIVLPCPIEYITKVQAKFNAYCWLEGESVANAKKRDITVDVTKFFVEKNIFITLDLPNSAGEFTKLHQGNSFSYSQGDSEISLNGTSQLFTIFNITKMEYFIRTIPFLCSGETSDGKVTISSDNITNQVKWNTILFNVQYQALDKSLVRTYKQEKQSTNAGFSANFSENRIEVDRIVDNMFTMINRIGNEEIVLGRHIKNNNEETKIGDFITIDGTKYKCVSSETSQFENHKQNVANFTKNYFHVSNYVGVDTEHRQYEIPRTGIRRNIELDDFVFFTINDPNTKLNKNNSFIYDLKFLEESLASGIIDGVPGDEEVTLIDRSVIEQQKADYTIEIDYNIQTLDYKYFKLDSLLKEKISFASYIAELYNKNNDGSEDLIVRLSVSNENIVETRETGTMPKGNKLVLKVSNNFKLDGVRWNTIKVTCPNIVSGKFIDSCIWGAYDTNGELISGRYLTYLEDNPYTPCEILTQVRSEGAKNTTIFNFGFDDTIVVGTTLYWDGSKTYSLPVYYSGKDGKMPLLSFQLGKNITKYTNNNNEQLISYTYPCAGAFDIKVSLGNKTKNADELLYIDKDVAEKLSMTYQIHYLPENDKEMTTNNIGEFCSLVGNQSNGVGIYERENNENDFTSFDDIVPLGKTITPITLQFETLTNQQGISYVKINVGNRTKKFALVDIATRKILLACNKPTQYIYAYSSHDR